MKENSVKALLIVIPLILAAMFIFDRVDFSKPINPIQAAPAEEKYVNVPSNTELLAKIYTAEIGVRELTGKNDGVRVEQYLASCGLGKGYPWCAAFPHWCHGQIGITGGGAYSPNWFPEEKTIYVRGGNKNQSPRKTDVLGIYYQNMGRIAHVGFIDEWGEGDYTITVEGNTGSDGGREGDGVYRKRRLKNQIYKVSRWI